MQEETKNLIQLTDKIFTEEVLKTPGLVLLDFYADWCGPCQQMMPTVISAAEQYDGKIRFYKVDSDNFEECGGLLSKFQVRSIPTYVILKIEDAQESPTDDSSSVQTSILDKMIGGLDSLTFLEKIENVVKSNS
jgi:thioredoxin 1